MIKFKKIAEFNNDGTEWSGYPKAVSFCQNKNLSVGQHQGPSPTALFNDDSIVSKWRNLSKKDKDEMFGYIDCPDKRNGTATVYTRTPL